MIFRAGDIGFVIHRKAILSRIIAWAMGSRWSHSFLVTGPDSVVETTSTTVKEDTVSQYINSSDAEYEIYRPNLTDMECFYVAKEGLTHLGEWYGYSQLISLGIRRLFMAAGINIKNFFRSRLVCCHVVTYAYEHSRIRELSSSDPEAIDTEELYQIVKNSPNFQRIL